MKNHHKRYVLPKTTKLNIVLAIIKFNIFYISLKKYVKKTTNVTFLLI